MTQESEPSIVVVEQALEPADWDAVREIYLEGIATGQATFETEAPSWAQWHESHLPHSRLVARECLE